MKRLLSFITLSLVLVGCGQKGPLYKTPSQTPNQVQSPATSAPPQTAQGE